MHFGWHLCNPVTSPYFSWILMNWSEPSPRKAADSFNYLAQSAAKSGFGDQSFISCSRADLSGSEQEQVARENGGKAKQWMNQPGTQRPKTSLHLPLPAAAGLSHQAHGKNDQGPQQCHSTKEHSPSKRLSNLSCRAASLPAPHHSWLNSSSQQ